MREHNTGVDHLVVDESHRFQVALQAMPNENGITVYQFEKSLSDL